MIPIDGFAYASKLARTDPKAKLWFSLLPLMLCILLDSVAVGLACLLVMSYATLKNSSIGTKRYLSFLSIPMVFLFLGTLTILIGQYSLSAHLLVGVTIGTHQYGISAMSLWEGGKLICKSLGAVSCMYFLSFNTPMVSLFQTLRHTIIPDLFVSLMELIYRYIFVIWEEAQKMRTAQSSRLGYTGFFRSLKSAGTLAAALFFRAYQKCDRSYAALESRGYHGSFEALEEEYLPDQRLKLFAFLFSGMLLLLGITERLALHGGKLI
ncbi:MAG: cobalt ECF transporter T component CbiQ [Massiliimalia sp.]|jgi:cobalt/nickel transport system permease protein